MNESDRELIVQFMTGVTHVLEQMVVDQTSKNNIIGDLQILNQICENFEAGTGR